MLAKVHTAAVVGLDGEVVEVEVDTSRGLPSFSIVGLPNKAVQESRERVQAAVKNAGLTFPRQRATVNLAPADLRKESSAFDLPIALGATVVDSPIIGAAWRNPSQLNLNLGSMVLSTAMGPSSDSLDWRQDVQSRQTDPEYYLRIQPRGWTVRPQPVD